MAKIQIVDDSIELAKELAWELELRPNLPSEDDIYGALAVMNGHLFSRQQHGIELIKAAAIFNIPDHDADVAMFEEWEVDQARIDDAIFKAKVEQFIWFGSVTFTGFGLRVHGLNFIEPPIHHIATAFVPVEYIDLKLAA